MHFLMRAAVMLLMSILNLKPIRHHHMKLVLNTSRAAQKQNKLHPPADFHPLC